MANTSGGTEYPSWLKEEVFVEFLKRDIKDFKAVSKFQLQDTCAKGEHFTTTVLRVKIIADLKVGGQADISYIVKLLPTAPSMRDMVSSWKVFDKERISYSYYIPEFEQMFRDVNKPIKFGANYYETSNPLPPTTELIILEDLRNRGFKNANRQLGLDMKHTLTVLEKLSQFHAASAVRYELKGAYPNLYDRSLCCDEDKFQEFRDTQARSLIQALPLYDAAYLEKALKSYTSQAADMFQAYALKFEDEFRCLNHGDFHCNNIMFHYNDDGQIKETKFIDLQMSRYCSPAQDLLYILLSSVSIELKISKFDYFVSFYHSKLIENLKLLQYPKTLPTLRSIHVAIINHIDWVYPVISLLLPLLLVDPTEKANMETMMDQETDGNQLRNTMFGNPRIKEHLKKILPWAYHRGLFECIENK